MYKTLYNLPQFPAQCIREATTAKYTQAYNPDQLRAFSSFNSTPFVANLQKEFGQCGGLYMKNLPMSYYDWHIDMGRQCSINWLLQNVGGSAFYREEVVPPRGKKSITYKLTKVEYQLYKPTILDVTRYHCVINDTQEDRIIFSLSINAPFSDVHKYLSSLEIPDYESC